MAIYANKSNVVFWVVELLIRNDIAILPSNDIVDNDSLLVVQRTNIGSSNGVK